ncbi:MAG: PAS domain-containing protein [Spirochaetales bacterium]|nr:PAS domain-containing protein [Spirochaetales bacterium]
MILVRRILYWFLAGLVSLGIAGAGVLGYILIKTAAADSAEHAGYMAEKYLFISLTAALLFLVVFITIVIRSVYLDREMDKIIELNRFQDFSPERSMKKLGIIGKKITALYHQLNILNEKKSLKISAQYELTAFLVTNMDLPLAVCDVTGTIIHTSSSFLTKLEKGKADVVGYAIDGILTDISIQTVTFELGRIHRVLEKKSGKNTVTCYPIHNRQNDVAYVVFVLDKKAVYAEDKETAEVPVSSLPSRLQKTLGRFFSRRR